jgi:predicted TIM-barrel fold metal-dependent hydrolase
MDRYYQAISADGHLECPADWAKYLPEKFKARAPRVVELEDGSQGWVVENRPLFRNGRVLNGGRRPMNIFQAFYTGPDGKPVAGAGGPVQRLQEQDLDGIDAEVLFPAVQVAKLVEGISERSAYLAMIQAYNTWAAQDYCSVAPDRLIACGQIPVSGIDDAVAELKRCKELGLKTVTFHQFPNGGGRPKPEDDRFWATAIDIGMALSPHGSFGDEKPPMIPPPGLAAHIILGIKEACFYTIAQLLEAEVFDRFPDLRIYFAETNAGWMPQAFYMFEDRYDRYRGAFNAEFKMRPTEYIKKHVRFSIIEDPMAMRLREFYPVAEDLMWGSDLPHGVTSFPRSREALDLIFEGVPDQIRRKVLVDNPCEFFGLDPTKPITPTPAAETADREAVAVRK